MGAIERMVDRVHKLGLYSTTAEVELLYKGFTYLYQSIWEGVLNK